jgi:hypothetical protein
MVDDTPVSPPVSTGGIPPVPEVASVSEVSLSVQHGPEDAGESPSEQKRPSFVPTLTEAVLPEEVSIDSGWGPLELAVADPPRLLYEHMHEPSEQSPILYCERGYVVDSLAGDEELAAHLLAELGLIQGAWQGRDSSQFVQLASFDHSFETEPDHPPLATLSWKDWQGGAELWVRGVRRSTPPERAPFERGPFEESRFGRSALHPGALDDGGSDAQEPAASSSAPEDEAPSSQVGILPPERFESPERFEPSEEPLPMDTTLSSERARSRKPDSGTSWQSPSRSGEYPIHRAEEEVAPPPPSSQRVLAGEELVGALFERMHELLYLPDLAAGASYVLETVEEFIPCAGALIHGFDADSKTFSVLCCIGPQAAQVLHTRTPSAGSHLESASRGQGTSRLSGSVQSLWQALGLQIERALCIPVQQQGRYLGIIELGRAPGEVDFSDTEVEAIGYIAEQFAEFLADRARLIESDPPPASP